MDIISSTSQRQIDVPIDGDSVHHENHSFSQLQQLPPEIVLEILTHLGPSAPKSIKPTPSEAALMQANSTLNNLTLCHYHQKLKKKLAHHFVGPASFKHNPTYLPGWLKQTSFVQSIKEQDLTQEISFDLPPQVEEEKRIDFQTFIQSVCCRNAIKNFSHFLKTSYFPPFIKKVDLTLPLLTAKKAATLLSHEKLKSITHLRLKVTDKLPLNNEPRSLKDYRHLAHTIASLSHLEFLTLRQMEKFPLAILLKPLSELKELSGSLSLENHEKLPDFTALEKSTNFNRLSLSWAPATILEKMGDPLLQKLKFFRLKNFLWEPKDSENEQTKEKTASAFKKMTSLTEINIEAIEGAAHHFFPTGLPRSPHLKAVTLSQASFSKKDLKCLLPLNGLEKLHLHESFSSEIDKEEIKRVLKNKHQLQDLLLSFETLTDDGLLQALQEADCKNLKALRIMNCPLKPCTLKTLLQTYELEYFSLGESISLLEKKQDKEKKHKYEGDFKITFEKTFNKQERLNFIAYLSDLPESLEKIENNVL